MLSVIIHTCESERALVRTLASLVPGASAGLVKDVIVADCGSKDDSAAIGDGAGCVVLVQPGPLHERLQAAAKMARGDWLMWLRPGASLEPGWVGEVERFIELRTKQAANFRYGTRARGSLFAEGLSMLWQSLSRRVSADQGLIITKPLYVELGGHRAANDTETDLLARLRGRIAHLRSGLEIVDSVK